MAINNYQETIATFRKGNEKSFEQLYTLLYGPLFYYIQRIVGNAAETEEIAADTFLKLWKLRNNFETLPAIRSFLYITARNASLNVLKQKKDVMRRDRQVSYFFYSQYIEDCVPNDEIKGEVVQRLLARMEQLPGQCRKVVTLSFFKGLKNAEVARALGITLQTVKNQKTNALKLLRQELSRKEKQLLVLLVNIISYMIVL